MIGFRIIPCLLLRNGGVVKTMKFRKPQYVGDPLNAIRIFNEKEVDENFGDTLGELIYHVLEEQVKNNEVIYKGGTGETEVVSD